MVNTEYCSKRSKIFSNKLQKISVETYYFNFRDNLKNIVTKGAEG